MWTCRALVVATGCLAAPMEPTGCGQEKLGDFLGKLSTGAVHKRPGHACGKRLRPWIDACGKRKKPWSRPALPGASSGQPAPRPVAPCAPGRTVKAGSGRGWVCTPQEERAGYPSRVCSILGAASTWGTTPGASQGIDRIAEAIDQLETDLRAESTALEMSARVAGIWLMVTALDPELSRFISRYTAPASPADGTGSLRPGLAGQRRSRPEPTGCGRCWTRSAICGPPPSRTSAS
jgi:hypothetical protein